MTIVTSGHGDNALVTYHSQDTVNAPISDLLSSFLADCRIRNPGNQKICQTFHVKTYHIQDAANTYGSIFNGAAPSINFTAQTTGQPLSKDGPIKAIPIYVNVTNASSGILGVEVTEGAPVLDNLQNIYGNTASYLLSDHNVYPTSHSYPLDLSSLAVGTHVFIQVLDGAGNLTSASLTIAPSVPQVGMTDVFGATLYESAAAPSLTPTTLASPSVTKSFAGTTAKSPMSFSITAAGAASVAVTGPDGAAITPAIDSINGAAPTGTVDPANIPAGAYTVTGFFSADKLGSYNMTTTDAAGAKTSTPFRVNDLRANVDPASTAVTDVPNKVFSANYSLALTASGFLDHIDRYDLTTKNTISSQDLGGAAGAQNTTAQVPYSFSLPLSGTDGLGTITVDRDGNSFRHELKLNTATPIPTPMNLPVPGPGSQFLSQGTPGTYNNASFQMGFGFGGFFLPLLSPNGSGSYTSPVFDVFASSMLPGSLLMTGPPLYPFPPPAAIAPFKGWAQTAFGPPVAGPISDNMPLMALTLTFTTSDNPDLSQGVQTQIFQGNLIYSNGTITADNFPVQQIRVKRYYRYSVAMTNLPQTAIARAACTTTNDGVNCLAGSRLTPGLYQLGPGFTGLQYNLFSGPSSATGFEIGQNLASDLGFGWRLSGFTTTAPGTVDIAVGSAQGVPFGSRALPANAVFDLMASPAGFYTGPFTLSFNYDPTGLSAAQMNGIALYPVDQSGRLGDAVALTNDTVNHVVSFSANSFGRYMFLVPQFTAPTATAASGFNLVAPGNFGLTATGADPASAPLSGLISALLAAGKALVSPVVLVTPEGTPFPQPGVVTMGYSSALAAASGAPLSGLNILQFSANGSYQVLANQFRGYQQPLISAAVPSINSYFAVFADTTPAAPRDVTPPATIAVVGASSFTATDGTLFVSSSTPVTLSASDPANPDGSAGSGVASIQVSIDSGPYAAYASTLTFSEGPHLLRYFATDSAGNSEAPRSLSLKSDATPPVSALVIGSPRAAWGDGSLVVTADTPFLLTANDPSASGTASGVKDSFLSVDGAAYAAVSGTFTMTGADGPRALSYYSRDRVLNVETALSTAVVLDATPPALALSCPSPESSGLCRVFKGRIPLLGGVSDAHLASYRLEYGPGTAPAAFTLISSGTVAVSSGSLGTWDASGLSGAQTLRFSAQDAVGNAASQSVGVFVGDPAATAIAGGRGVLDKPQGVAVGTDGRVYVADRNDDRVAVFTATGGFAGAIPPDAKGRPGSLRLNKPASVAVDGAGNVYVADTNDARVIKLSPDGTILLELTGFSSPAGVAVDAAGRIYATDASGNFAARYSAAGTRELRIDGLNAPAGVAVNTRGDIYVADSGSGRVLAFDADGRLLARFGSGLSVPQGVAVSPSGDCVVVTDTEDDRVLKFDRLGEQTLVFGSDASFNKPYQLAFDAAGQVWIADRNDDRVVRYGAPDGTALDASRAASKRSGAVTSASFSLAVVARDLGGSVARTDATRVDVPAGALPADAPLTIAPVVDSDSDAVRKLGARQARGLSPASEQVEFGPTGSVFSRPVTITIPYDLGTQAVSGARDADVKIQYWNPQSGDWEALASVVDPVQHLVSAQTTHFSIYQAAVVPGGSRPAASLLAAADPSFGLRAVYVFPNPARASATIRVQPGQADSVSVRIYDVSGRKVHESSDFAVSQFDDGNGLGTQYTYDHVWDLSGVGSGVYTYAVTARRAGQANAHRTGRIGVVK